MAFKLQKGLTVLVVPTGDSSASGPSRQIRSSSQILLGVRETLWPALRTSLDNLPERLRAAAITHFGWQDSAGGHSSTPLGGGKALRPALTLLCCQAMGGRETAGLPAAIAVELVHNATLLHDDIIDGDRMRRGRVALWAASGVRTAILTGDALFFLAVQTLAQAGGALRTSGVELLSVAVQDLVSGEHADSLFEHQRIVSVEAAQAMARAKTGTLVATACRLGALAADADERSTDHIGRFGALIGEAFQFTDDVLGIWGDPALTGKPAGSDLRARKKSLPVSFALASPGGAGREPAALYARPEPFTEDEVTRAASLVEEAGGRAWSEHRAADCTAEALVHLDAARPDPVASQELTRLAHRLTRRDR